MLRLFRVAAAPQHETTAAAAASGEKEPAHEQTLLQTVAKLANFGILAGVLVYFLRGPITSHLSSRALAIRQDLVTAAEMRKTATEQLAAIDRKLKTLPAELDALKQQGAQDVAAEQARIAEAAAADRDRLLAADAARDRDAAARRATRADRTRGAARGQRRGSPDPAVDYDRRSAPARRSLHGAAPGGAMTSRAAGVRYARALFDVALKESDVRAGRPRSRGRSRGSSRATRRSAACWRIPASRRRRSARIVDQLLQRAGTSSPIVAKLLRLLADRDRLRSAARDRHRVSRPADGAREGRQGRGRDRGAAAAGTRRRRFATGSRRRPDDGPRTCISRRASIRSIIGGAITRIGSTVYDGSVTRQLEKMRDALVANVT